MFESIFSGLAGVWEILICSIFSIVFGLIIAITHRFTSKYSKNFLITIALLPFLVQMVIIMVNGNLGTSIAIAGAFSLVRFRSIPGTSKEILSVFFAMIVGLSMGMGNIGLGTLITLIGCISMFIYSYITLFDTNQKEKILKITIPEDLNYTEVFNDEFNKYLKNYSLEQVKTINMGSLFDLTYKIILKNGVNEKNFIDDLRVKNGNLKIMISQPLNDYEL